jgi:hypothetical protein
MEKILETVSDDIFRKKIQKQRKTNFVALVRARIIPTERPPLVGEVSANFCGQRVLRGQYNGSYGSILGFLDRWKEIPILN